MPERRPTDLRAERARAERHLALAVVVFLLGVGTLAIALTYGNRAAILGALCLLVGVLLFGLLWGILTLLERWVNS